MKIEHRCLQQRVAKTRLESRSEGETGKIQGYAAVFFNASDPENTQYAMWDDYFERIMPGAFDSALKDDDVRCLYNHDPNQVLGRSLSNTLQLSVDDTGLFYTCDCPDTVVGRDVATLLNRNDVSGSSFSFEVIEAEYREEEGGIWYREVTKVKLYDVGPVTFPAYAGTSSEVAQRSLQRHKKERRCNALGNDEQQRQQRERALSLLSVRHRRNVAARHRRRK